MKAKKIIGFFLILLIAFSIFAGCGSDEEEYDLKVTFYNGGFGSAWLEHSAAEFEKLKGIKIKLVPSSDLDCGAYTYLKSGKNLSDIYINAMSYWTSWVNEGLLADLSDVYETEVDTDNGKVKIKDYIHQDVVDKFYLEKRVGSGSYKPWVIPWSLQVKALAYNVDILEDITHNSDIPVEGLNKGEKWKNPPKTISELRAFFEDVVTYDNGQGKYVPFGWTGKNPEAFFNFLFPIWAQYQGVEESKVPGQGAYYDFWNVGNTVAFNGNNKQTFSLKHFDQTGLQVAYDTLISLIVKNGQFVNGLPDATSLTPQELEKTFVSNSAPTNCVITLGSSYLEYEAGLNGYLDSDKDGKQDYRIRFLPVPHLDEYEGEDLIYTPVGDVMFIPAKAKNVQLAKEFLAFMCNQEQLEYFTKVTGSLRPFNYDPRNIEGANYSDYTLSVFEAFFNSTHLFEYPKGIQQNMVSYVYRYEKINIIGITSVNTIYNFLRTKTGAQIMQEVKKDLENLVVSNWISKYQLDRTD